MPQTLTKIQKQTTDEEYVTTFCYHVNPNDNGGEAVFINVDVFDNGDETHNLYCVTEIQALCYGTSKTILTLHLGPKDFLRAFGDIFKAVEKMQKK